MAASLVFRLHDRGPELVREVLLERGWEEYDGRKQEEEDWNLYWRGSTFRSSEYHNLLPWQRLNHHPKTAGITRKDSLVRNLRRMRATFGSSLYDFSPTTFILPNDFTRFLAEFNKLRLTSGPAVYWICKPVDLSRGRGIFIFEDIKDLVYDCSVIVQRYISSPLLISGYKFDLRIYVCVKSFHPLTVYIHQEGLVRFATEKYNLTSLSNLFAHLTNTSINKFGPFYKSEKGRVGQGCKWTMSKFRHFLRSQDINEVFLWQRINNIITLTLLTIAPTVPSCPNCVELFGFDVLIDSKFKPWLLEVNYSPALTLDCQADVSVKKGLIGDLIDLMNYTSTDSLRVRAYQKHRHRQPCFNTLPLLSTLKQNRIQKKKKHKKTSQTRPEAPDTLTLWCCVAVAPSLPVVKVKEFKIILSSQIFVHRGSQGPIKSRVGGPAALNAQHIPPVRVGGFIRTFPFNAATLKASQHEPDVTTIIQELQKLTGRLASCQLSENMRTREESAGKDCFGSLLWGPKDPSMLGRCFKPS
uniref:Tubulin tyrosine ligase-like family, member 2 n=1 Tax=Kryptolebias marmoratus TaxID=37003 RepID=A0A3Q2ZX91_KRYMA